ELYIGGAGVGRGYAGQAALTAEKFVPDRFSGEAGARLYRTGDLVRYDQEGKLEFVGRVDEQVKLRGYRIELGEIEAVLRRHPQVRAAVVVLREENEDKRLVAYVVSEAQTNELRAYLKEQLPDYMAPSFFVTLDELPLLPNGKLNRRALPAPERISAEEAKYEVPRTQTEELLCGMLASVLRLDRVGINDNFFELGGHSLLAIQLISRIRDAFGVELPLSELFERRTVAELAQGVDDLMRASHELIVPPLHPAIREDVLPLSFAQQRLWFLDQLVLDNIAYNVADALRLRGELNVAALEQSISEIMRRHEAVRTTFPEVDGNPSQVITPFRRLELPLIDLRSLPAEEREAQAVRIASAEAQRPFDLQSGPLMRVTLLLLEPDDHVLLFTIHHVISDEWSTSIFTREVAALYDAFTTGNASPLPELAIQYADFAVWQRQWLSSDVLARQLDYWTSKLQGIPPLFALPADYPRPKVQLTEGALSTHLLSAELTSDLKLLAQQSKATLYMTIMAAFHALLHRYAQQVTVVTGTVVANRTRIETEPLIGFFANTLVLRSDFDDDPTFLTHLDRSRKHALEAYAHQDLPFEMLVDELQLARDLSYHPLFQVMFSWEETAWQELALTGLELGAIGVENHTSQFDLTLRAGESNGQLRCTMQYNTALFEASTISRMLTQFERLLASAVRDPEQHISQLELLSSAEQRQLLVERNDTHIPYPHTRCIHELFEEQVALSPEAPALTFQGRHVSYAELNSRANQLAHYLRQLAVGTELPVGICLNRSIDMVVAVFAVLKAGGVYIPLDPEYPVERLACILDEVQPSIILTDSSLIDELPSSVRVLCLDTDQEWWSQLPDTNLTAEVSSDNLAHVLYTSGSTGTPKGVAVPHRGVVRLVKQETYVTYGPGEVFLQMGSLSFDASTLEIFSALLTGGRLVLMPPGAPSLDDLAEVLTSEGVSKLWITAGLFHPMVEHQVDALAGVRDVMTGGDVVSVEHVRRLVKAKAGNGCVINGYGPTESTVFTSCHRVSSEEELERGLPIGKPIGNTQVYVLGKKMELLADGVVGELYVGGDGLARCYYKQPELTAERFVPHPFSRVGGERLYRTGDYVRWRADGLMEFAGRMDTQVKIRGYRIEPGEVEAVLARHASVSDCAVVARQDFDGAKQLVAYVVTKANGHGESTFELREYLRERLPEFMIPAAIVTLDSLPLTRNGKVDRRELAAREVRVESDRAYAAPRTTTEQILCDIWQEVLHVERVGVNDNFFDLGGDSILTIQVIVKARAAGLELNVQQLFQQQTIYELAQVLQLSEGNAAVPQTEPFSLIGEEDRAALPAGVVDAYPLTALQAGMLFHSELDPEAGLYHDIFSFHLRIPFDGAALDLSLQQLIELHPVLRTSFNLSDFSEPLQLVHEKVMAPLRMGDLRGLSVTEQEEYLGQWLAAEKRHRFDWRTAPLLRFQIERRSEETFQFSITFHHAILDGWSLATMLTELFSLYASVMRGEAGPSEALVTASFRDFVAAERAVLECEEARQYWMTMLSEAPHSRLPRLGPSAGPSRVAGHHVEISPELSFQLKELARTAGVPLKSVLLAAHLRVLNVLTGSHEVLTGIVSHGRSETADGERVLGLFLNTLPFRRRLAGGAWLELVQETFAAERELLPFRRYPMARMQQELGNDTPLFEVTFNFVHFHVYEELQHVGGLEVLGFDGVADTNFTLAVDFSLELGGAQLGLGLQYDAAELSAEQIAAVGRHYLTILESMAARPHERYERQCLLSPEERQKILYEWNEAATFELDSESYLDLFEAQVVRTPEAPAAVLNGEQLTYEELNRRANQLARYLQGKGVGPEVPVGVLLERSLEMVMALLAIFKAGGAYVPLDATYPEERLRFMVRDAGLELLLTTEKLSRRFSEPIVQSIRLDAEWPEIANQSEENLTLSASAANLAYVIYTSGSSGRPKGVMITQGNMLNRLQARQRSYELTEQDAFLLHTSLNFDPSVWEVFWPLMVGGRVVIAPAGMLESSALLQYMAEQSVSCAYFVPSQLSVLVKDGRLS
ncbi:MAG TPA: amino acid adenylation domain-containing protein, partial [Pyrinomonadaceae bacterium]|nr:amino acid adenylation domain-containing protein [Pyrinomonadaceae bacterium]